MAPVGALGSAGVVEAPRRFLRPPFVHDDEVLAALCLIAHGNAARRAVERPGPQHFARVFIVGAHLAVVAGMEHHASLRDDDAVARADAAGICRAAARMVGR